MERERTTVAPVNGGGADVTVVLVDVADRIGTITLNRPERRNALDGETVAALDAAVKAMADDSAVKVVVLTGARRQQTQETQQ
jgi:enoyl-CoA hydratase/carnithine racemase